MNITSLYLQNIRQFIEKKNNYMSKSNLTYHAFYNLLADWLGVAREYLK